MPKLLDQVRAIMRRRHYSPNTGSAYLYWIKRFIIFHDKRHPSTLGQAEATSFLSHLARVDRVAATTQNQALAAILFLYKDTLNEPLPWLGQIEKSKRPARLPVVFTESEVERVFSHLSHTPRIMATLLYGG